MKEGIRKRGSSRNLLLLTLLILISISIIWFLLKIQLDGTANKISFYESELSLNIQKVTINESFVNVVVARNPGRGKITGLSFAISKGNLTEVFIEKKPLEELEIKPFTLKPLALETDKIESIKISPIFKLTNGEEMVGEVKDEYRVYH